MEVACLVAIRLHWTQISQQQCRYMQEKTHIRIVITKINIFSTESPMICNQWFTKLLRLGIVSLRAFTCVFSCDLIKVMH